MKVKIIYQWFFFLLILPPGMIACNNEQPKGGYNNNNELHSLKGTGHISFDTTFHHFGTLVQGEKVAFTFQFTNSGDGPVLVKDVKAGCGCTVASWSKDPIPPGNRGGIEIVFDSSGRRGNQYKTATVITNGTQREHMLVITAEIKQ